MRNRESSPSLTNCTFSGNDAYEGAGMFNKSSLPNLVNCSFIENFADQGEGGGMWNGVESESTLINCTFIRNGASEGGGIFNDDSPPILTNCILWGNVGGEILGDTIVNFSDIQGGWTGTGNINVDPQFADPDGRLLAGSPCINRGDKSAVPADVTTDLDDKPRIVGFGVDMGTYEYQQPGPEPMIIVQPVDKITGKAPVKIIFYEVTEDGVTTLVTSLDSPEPPTPPAYILKGVYYEITTTLVYDPPADIEIQYDDTGMEPEEEEALRLYHFENDDWVDVTVLPVDIDNNIIRGSTNSFSPFAIFFPDETPPEISGVSASPEVLWPPNHKTVEVLISGCVVDDGSGLAQVLIGVMDEYGELSGEGYNITGFLGEDGVFAELIELIAWRDGDDLDGRLYTIIVYATDKAGNVSEETVPVTVPHDQGEGNGKGKGKKK